MSFGRSLLRVALLTGVVLLQCVAPVARAATETYLDGYFRLRARLYDNLALNREAPLDAAESDQASSQSTQTYFEQRLRVQPELRVNQYLSVHAQMDFLPDLVWGTDPNRQSSNGYYEPMGQSQSFLSPTGSALLDVRRAWAEVYTPFGRLKVGRTGMEVGAGMYFNEGNGIDDDYGDTADRVQFLTRLGDFWLLAGYDKIYEGAADSVYDSSAVALALAYRTELASSSFYAYMQDDNYRPDEGQSDAIDDSGLPDDVSMMTWTFDLWGKATLGPIDLELEAIFRYGTGTYVSESVDTDEIEFIEEATVASYGGMARLNWARKPMNFGIEFGLASGDDTSDSKLTTFEFDRDYNIAFLMFRAPMPTRASLASDESADDIYDTAIIGESVSNAWYLQPSVSTTLFSSLTARLSGTFAWTMADVAAYDYQNDYGYEIDLELSSQLFDRLTLGGRGALFFPGSIFGDTRDFAFGGELRAVVQF